MLNDTTRIGQVGEPTPIKIANQPLQSKQSGSQRQIAPCPEVPDDFSNMTVQGLHHSTANRLRRLAHGLAGIRELATVLNACETERQLRDMGEASGPGAIALSPRSTEGLLQGAVAFADLLNQEVYALGIDLTSQLAGGSE